MPFVRPVALLAMLLTVATPALAQFRDQNDPYLQNRVSNQNAATKAAENQTILSYDKIIKRVSPKIGGKLIASDYDPSTYTYRLRYMRAGAVVNVDVDARSANIIRREGF